MNQAPRPQQQERRRHKRITPPNVRVRCVSGEFDDLTGGVNFAKRLLNLGKGGMCIETTGRLRAGITMSIEVRFDDFGGSLRTKAQMIWVDTLKEGAAETYVAGFRFIGPELTASVREFLDGGRGSMIASRRQAEYVELKEKAEIRKAGAARKPWSAPKKTAVGLFAVIFLYVAGFGGLVTIGRREAPSGTHYRYLGPESKGGGLEEGLATLYSPMTWLLRRAGVDLTYDRP
jgi:hypothetical protein